MSRNSALLIALALAACSNAPAAEPDGEEPVTAITETVTPSPENLFGRWGATAADCDPANRYMTEFVELDGERFRYRDEDHAIIEIDAKSIRLNSGELIKRDGDTLTRWPDDKARRTDYHRCG